MPECKYAPQSDIDLLVYFPEQITLFDLGAMKVELMLIPKDSADYVTFLSHNGLALLPVPVFHQD